METVRLSWHNACMWLQNYLPADQAEGMLTSARARGFVTASGFQVTADPGRRYEPDEFEVGPAPAGAALPAPASRPAGPPGEAASHTDLDEWPPPVPRTTAEFNALWNRVLVKKEIPDPTPYGMGGDQCPYCFSDWKDPHDRNCAYKGR